jgi:hypothetical protein
MHSDMQVKQHKITILPIFRSPYLGEKYQLNIEHLDDATTGGT